MMLDGNAAGALPIFSRAIELQPTLHEARLNRALAWLRTGQPAKASADLGKIWADETSALRADAAYHNGIALDRIGRPLEAETWLERALALDPRLDAALLYLGALRERRGDLQSAGRAYLTYLESHPDSTAAALRFGMVAHRAGRNDVARIYLQRVAKAAPDSPEGVEAQKFLVMWE